MPRRISVSFFDPEEGNNEGIVFNQVAADLVTEDEIPSLGEYEKKFLTWYQGHPEGTVLDLRVEGGWLLDAPHEEICKAIVLILESSGVPEDDQSTK